MAGALEGLTVLEVGEGVSAPFCGKLLSDYGATVIKVEPPAGDVSRRAGPFPDDRPHPEKSALFLYLNTGKRSVTLDPSSATGRRLFEALALQADMLVESTPAGWLEERGLAWERLHEVNPRLLMVSVSPFGRSGPCAGWRSTNLTAYAAGGQMAMTGDPDREPLVTTGHQADYQAGLNAFAATLAALVGLAVMEVGQRVEVSAMECQVATLEIYLPDYAYRRSEAITKRRGNVHSALLGLYPCRDGHLGFHTMPRQFEAIARLMGAEWMLEDDRFSSARARLRHNDELTALIYAWAAERSKEEVYRRAAQLRAPVAFVHSLAESLASPQLRARRFFQEVEHADASAGGGQAAARLGGSAAGGGRLVYPGPPFRLGDGGWELRPAPRLGEHNQDVYCDLLGLSRRDLWRLRAYGVI